MIRCQLAWVRAGEFFFLLGANKKGVRMLNIPQWRIYSAPQPQPESLSRLSSSGIAATYGESLDAISSFQDSTCSMTPAQLDTNAFMKDVETVFPDMPSSGPVVQVPSAISQNNLNGDL